MKIAIPVKDNSLESEIDSSLGRCKYFLIYNIDRKEEEYIKNTGKTSQGGAGIEAGQIIVDTDAKILLTERCGIKAGKVLDVGRVEIYKIEGNKIEENIDKYLNGELSRLEERSSSKKSGGR